jgi:hypothetical protein
VVTTDGANLIRPYYEAKLITVAKTSGEFILAIEKVMNESQYDPEWLERVDQYLADNSWDKIFESMSQLEKEKQNQKISLLYQPYSPLDHSLSLGHQSAEH